MHHAPGDEPHENPREQSKKVREQIAMWARPQHSQKCQPAHHRRCALEPRPWAGGLVEGELRRRENADRAEHRRRGTDGEVPGAVPKRVHSVAERSGEQHQERTTPVTEPTVDRGEKNAPGERIAEHVQRVGVEGERGDRAPDLAVENAATAAVPLVNQADESDAGPVTAKKRTSINMTSGAANDLA